MKIVFSILLTLFSVLFFSAEVSAKEITVKINDVPVVFRGQQPLIIEGRTFVPVRGVFEHMGFKVHWDDVQNTAILTGSDIIEIRRGDTFFTLNGERITPEVPPRIIGGRFMLPLRAIAEATGAEVSWDESAYAVFIYTIDEEPIEEEVFSVIVLSSDLRHGRAASSSANAAEGQIVYLTATPAEGYVFKHWTVRDGEITLTSANTRSTAFTTGVSDVSVIAVFERQTSRVRTITVDSNNHRGTASSSAETAEQGQTVTITATPVSGGVFEQWEVVSGGIILADAQNRITTFVAGASNIRIRAVFSAVYQEPEMTVTQFEQDIFALVNSERSRQGIEPYVWHSQAAQAARAHSWDLVLNNLNGHQGSDGSRAANRLERAGIELPIRGWAWAENVIRNQETPEAAMRALMNSSRHRNNILNEHLEFLGVGVEVNSAGRFTVTQKFINIRQYDITMETNGSDRGSASSSVTQQRSGQPVSITAEAAEGYTFGGWDVMAGDVSIINPTDTSAVFTMPSSDVKIRAFFTPVTAQPRGNGNESTTEPETIPEQNNDPDE
jgi:uncharacterized protein YkwD